MTYTLAIADRAYSSWSLRGWLMFERFGLPVHVRHARLYTDDFPKMLEEFAPARTVPALRTPEGHILWDTLAIAETLAERHPEAGHWPLPPAARAAARSLAAEMHSGFSDLRGDCPMNLRTAYVGYDPRPGVLSDLARIETLWDMARDLSDGTGPWLFGRYSAVDGFFAPVAARIATYGLPVGTAHEAYVAQHLADPAFRRWRAVGLSDGADQPVYAKDLRRTVWPGPDPIPARVSEGPSENATCPYSGEPVAHFLETGGRIFGFCNTACRDKTLADPGAWPAFTALL